jgi:cytosine/adenosine deaminase-related metal-dependent hydrolase
MPSSPPKTPPFTLKARFAFVGNGLPVDGGAVSIVGENIVRVGPSSNAPVGPVVDLGDAAIVPGLVNAHAHLEFSALAKPLGLPGMPFPAWIRAVVEWRQSADARSAAHAPAAATCAGLAASARFGVTAIGEMARGGWPVEVFAAAPIETVAFWESIGLNGERARGQPELARNHLEAPGAAARLTRGLAPHAPYTVRLDLLDRLVQLAIDRGAPVAMHLAESPEELELLASGTGPFVDLLEGLGAWDAAAIPRGTRPRDYLERLAKAPRSLVVHGNYLQTDELQFVADRADRMSLVVCPRTHAYFGHARHPLPRLLACGGNVAVGTDSLASNPDLNLWEELKFIAREFPEISPATILEMGTCRGARALGLEDRIGAIAPGSLANLAVIDLPGGFGGAPDRALERLFSDESRVAAAVHRGEWSRPIDA